MKPYLRNKHTIQYYPEFQASTEHLEMYPPDKGDYYHILLVNSVADGYTSYFHSLTIMNKSSFKYFF